MTLSKHLNTKFSEKVLEKGFTLKVWRGDDLLPTKYFISNEKPINPELLYKEITWSRIDLDENNNLISEIGLDN